MAYTASALAFLLRGLGKPVVVTGSADPARRAALATAARTCSPPCSSPRATTCARSASCSGRASCAAARAVKASASGFEAFASPNLPPLGMAGVQIEIDAVAAAWPGARARSGCRWPSTRRSSLLRLYPGMPASLLRAALGRADPRAGPRGLRCGHRADGDATLLHALAEGAAPRRGGARRLASASTAAWTSAPTRRAAPLVAGRCGRRAST